MAEPRTVKDLLDAVAAVLAALQVGDPAADRFAEVIVTPTPDPTLALEEGRLPLALVVDGGGQYDRPERGRYRMSRVSVILIDESFRDLRGVDALEKVLGHYHAAASALRAGLGSGNNPTWVVEDSDAVAIYPQGAGVGARGVVVKQLDFEIELRMLYTGES